MRSWFIVLLLIKAMTGGGILLQYRTQSLRGQPFFIEFFVCNPALAKNTPVFGQLSVNRDTNTHPIANMSGINAL